jgi:hypothetical protein
VRLETKTRKLTADALKRAVNTEAETFKPPSYDDWLKAGKPDDGRIRSVLAAFLGRPDLLERPRRMRIQRRETRGGRMDCDVLFPDNDTAGHESDKCQS